MDEIAAAADFFALNRRTDQVADTLPEPLKPRDLTAAYAIQRRLVERLLSERGGEQVGWKIACTSEVAQQLLRIDAPLFGQLLSSYVYPQPARLPAGEYFVRCIESEYAFQMSRDVPTGETYTPDSIADYIGAVLPSIEIVNHHFTDWKSVGGLVLAADNAIHGAWVHGAALTGWRDLDLADAEVRLVVNGQLHSTGSGANVLGHPLNVLAWLANELPRFDHRLSAGDYVTTGITTEIYLAEPGDELVADFGPLGTVSLAFE